MEVASQSVSQSSPALIFGALVKQNNKELTSIEQTHPATGVSRSTSNRLACCRCRAMVGCFCLRVCRTGLDTRSSSILIDPLQKQPPAVAVSIDLSCNDPAYFVCAWLFSDAIDRSIDCLGGRNKCLARVVRMSEPSRCRDPQRA